MPFADRKNKPLYTEKQVTKKELAPNFEMAEILEDVAEEYPDLAGEFEPSKELDEMLKNESGQFKKYPYAFFLHLVAAILTNAKEARKDLNARPMPFDHKGIEMRKEAMQELARRQQAAAERVAKEEQDKFMKELTGSKEEPSE